MKYGLLGLAALLLSTHAYAENYRIVQSPAQKLDVWIDDVKTISCRAGVTAPLTCASSLWAKKTPRC